MLHVWLDILFVHIDQMDRERNVWRIYDEKANGRRIQGDPNGRLRTGCFYDSFSDI